MAIQNARILIRRGDEADFNANNMQPGEWALSTDEKIVRICVAPGVCIRMATYDAFEADMAKIEAILAECRDIQTVVNRINDEVSENAKAVAEYTEQAKQYRDEAKQFRNEAEAFSPEGYSELVQNVEKNTVKIDTILEKGGLTFDESASGENIHLSDTTDNKVTAFALYGKATQESTTGKNLLENTATTKTVQGITWTVDNNGIVNANGTSSAASIFDIPVSLEDGVSYIASGISGGSADTYQVYLQTAEGLSTSAGLLVDGEKTFTKDSDKGNVGTFRCRVSSGVTVSNLKFYPMIRLATETDATYEPYTGGKPSPSPDYQKEMDISGASGSVAVKSVGKNQFDISKVTNGYPNATVGASINDIVASTRYAHSEPIDVKKAVTIQWKANAGLDYLRCFLYKNGIYHSQITLAYSGDGTYTIPKSDNYNKMIVVMGTTSAINVWDNSYLVEFQVEYGTVVTPYQTYKETTATIPTPNGLPGIPVSSGGNYTDENGQQWICDSIVKYADGTGKYVQRIKKRVLNGSEVYKESSATDDNRLCVYTSDEELPNTTNNAIISDTFIYGKYTDGDTLNIIGSIGRSINIGVSKTIASTVEDFKTWLASNPVTVYVELAEPIITDLSAEEIAEIEKLQTFYPVTNISNDAGCGMEIAYKADAKNYIDNIILARVATLETAVINNL